MAPVLQWQRPRNLQASQALSHAPTEKMEKAIMAVYAVWDLQACMRLHEYEIVWVITPEIPEAHEAQFNLSYLSWWFMWLGAFGCISLGSLECLYPSMFIQYDRDISRWSTKSCQLLWLIVVFGQNGSLLSLECGRVKVEPLEVGWYPSACQMLRLKQNILNISKISEISENSKDHINTNNSKASTCQISQNITNHIQHITTCLQLNHLHQSSSCRLMKMMQSLRAFPFLEFSTLQVHGPNQASACGNCQICQIYLAGFGMIWTLMQNMQNNANDAT